MNYIDFMRKVEGKPPKVEHKVDTSGFYYTQDRPPSLDVIRAVLAGDCDEVSSAFTWSESPQGYNHWDDIYEGDTQLTPADVQYLEWMLEEYS
jgi:hypothetical protein